MTLQTKEWLYHIQKWLEQRQAFIFQKIEPIYFRGYTTEQWLPYDKAICGAFKDFKPEVSWGDKWGYGWFLGQITFPPEVQGQKMVLKLNLGAESTVYVNGKLAGAMDLKHDYITLSSKAVAGETFEILAETYAGHGDERPIMGESSLVVMNEEVYQFFIDLETLYQLRHALDPNSLRVAEIDKGLLQVSVFLDFELSPMELDPHIKRCRELLKPLLDCVNGSTAPTLYMMGQSHLDVAWLWPIEETKRKIARTFSNQIALIEQYPNYIYVQSQPYLFQMVKTLYPELYGRIKDLVAEGRIIPEGGAWVEPDANIPSGESLIRQILHGKRFFKEEFDVDNEMLWMPDVFGYSGNLPQIMLGCRLRYFASVKMYQTYDNICEPFPYNTFTWQGIDGSKVLVHLLDYGPFPHRTDVSYVMNQWNERVQKDEISTRLVQFGAGDGGGGATRDDLEFLSRMGNLEGVPKTVISSPLDYFTNQEGKDLPNASFIGELYYPAHRGTYTSQAQMKKGNRKSEFSLRAAELWSMAAVQLKGKAYPYNKLDEAWKRLLLNQFHDILPGTSIQRVHEEAAKDFAQVIQIADYMQQTAINALVNPSREGITVFNSLAWERYVLVVLPDGYSGAMTDENEILPVQTYQDNTYAQVRLPSMGWVSIYPSNKMNIPNHLRATKDTLENEFLRVMFNEWGEIVSIFEKENGMEWTSDVCNRFKMYKDNPSNYDAWEIDRRYAQSPVDLPEKAEIEVIATGPLFAALRVLRRLNHSVMTQDIILKANGKRVEFHTKIDWLEKHKLLKVEFPVSIHSNEALHEIQFGYVKRPNHKSMPFDGDRFEVNQHKWSALVEGNRTFAILNDSKYGINVLGSSMNLTLLRASTYPDEQADLGKHEFLYAFHISTEGFVHSPLIHEAFEVNCLDVPVTAGTAVATSLFSCNQTNIIIDTIKLSEDMSGDIIVRLYESKGVGAAFQCITAFPIKRVYETNMLEETIRELPYDRRIIDLKARPFEVLTLRLSN